MTEKLYRITNYVFWSLMALGYGAFVVFLIWKYLQG